MPSTELTSRTFTAVIERDQDTGLFAAGYVPGWPGAHSQSESVDQLHANLREVIDMLLEDGEPDFDAEFVGTQTVKARPVPDHRGRDIAPGFIRQIGEDIGLSTDGSSRSGSRRTRGQGRRAARRADAGRHRPS